MNNKVLLLLLSLIEASALGADKKPWTFLVYIAGDNNLAKYADLDLEEMMEVGSNENVHVIAYVTVKRENEEKKTVKYYVDKGNLTQIGELMVKDSGDVETFTEALEWAHIEYPSDHFALVLWDHGNGILNRTPSWLKGICFDETTGHYLTDRNLFAAFGWIRDRFRHGKNIDVVACDACLMGSVEMGYTLQPYVDYYVASEETVPGNGFPYAQVLAPFKDGSPEPADFATNIVNVYAESYDQYSNVGYTLSALDLSQLDPLVKRLDLIAQFFTNQLKMRRNQTIINALKQAIQQPTCLHFTRAEYVDLYQCLSCILQSVTNMELDPSKLWYIKKVINDTLPLIQKTVIANKFSDAYKQSCGMSVYFPIKALDASYDELLWSEWTKWSEFMTAFFAI